MKETLLKFQTAKLAKEKGFNELSNWAYRESDLIREPREFERQYYHNDDEACNKIGMTLVYYSAPTQSLLQKWLREKYNIHISVERLKDNMWGSTVYSDRYEDKDLKETYDEIWNTWEEALEEGLQEALKLIKL